MDTLDSRQKQDFRDLVILQLEPLGDDEAAPLYQGSHPIVACALLHYPDLLDEFVVAVRGHAEALERLIGLAQAVLLHQNLLDSEGPSLLAKILERCDALGVSGFTKARFKQAWAEGLRLRSY